MSRGKGKRFNNNNNRNNGGRNDRNFNKNNRNNGNRNNYRNNGGNNNSNNNRNQNNKSGGNQHRNKNRHNDWDPWLDRNEQDVIKVMEHYYAEGYKVASIAGALQLQHKNLLDRDATFESLESSVRDYLLNTNLIGADENEQHLIELPIGREIRRLENQRKSPSTALHEIRKNHELFNKTFALRNFDDRLAVLRMRRYLNNLPAWQYQELGKQGWNNIPVGARLSDLPDDNGFDAPDEFYAGPLPENRNPNDTPSYFYQDPSRPQMEGFGGTGGYMSSTPFRTITNDQTFGRHQAMYGSTGGIKFRNPAQNFNSIRPMPTQFPVSQPLRLQNGFGNPSFVPDRLQPIQSDVGLDHGNRVDGSLASDSRVPNILEGRENARRGKFAHSDGGRWAFTPVNPKYGIFEQHDYIRGEHELIDNDGDIVMRDSEPVWINDHTPDSSYQRLSNGDIPNQESSGHDADKKHSESSDQPSSDISARLAAGDVIIPAAMPVPGRVLYDIVPGREFLDDLDRLGTPVKFQERNGLDASWPTMRGHDVARWSQWAKERLEGRNLSNGGSQEARRDETRAATDKEIGNGSGELNSRSASGHVDDQTSDTDSFEQPGAILIDTARLEIIFELLPLSEQMRLSNWLINYLDMLTKDPKRLPLPNGKLLTFANLTYYLRFLTKDEQIHFASLARDQVVRRLSGDIWNPVQSKPAGTRDPWRHVHWAYSPNGDQKGDLKGGDIVGEGYHSKDTDISSRARVLARQNSQARSFVRSVLHPLTIPTGRYPYNLSSPVPAGIRRVSPRSAASNLPPIRSKPSPTAVPPLREGPVPPSPPSSPSPQLAPIAAAIVAAGPTPVPASATPAAALPLSTATPPSFGLGPKSGPGPPLCEEIEDEEL